MDSSTDRDAEHVKRKQQVGQNLRAAREACGLSQDQLAARLGKSKNTVPRWESGENEMGVIDAIDAARELRTSVQALLDPVAVPLQRPEPIYFLSPAFIERLEKAKGRRVLDFLPTRPPVGIVLDPSDVQVTKEQYDASIAKAEKTFDDKAAGPMEKIAQLIRSLRSGG